MLFKAAFSKKIIFITLIFHVIFPFLIYRFLITKSLIDLLFLLLFIGCSLVTFSLSPHRFILNKDYLIIKYRIGCSKKYYIPEIANAQLKSFSSIKIPIRLLGSGGIWGYIGYFYSFTYGFTRVFVTDTANTVVLIKYKKQKILISPSDSKLFYESLQKYINIYQ